MTAKTTYYEILGLDRRYHVEARELEARYHAEARAHHPDRHVKDEARARVQSALRTAELTQAYRTLKDPVKRAEYLLEIEGVHIGDERGAHKGSPAFLGEMLELREGLEEAEAAGDEARVQALGADVRARQAQALRDIDAGFTAWEGGGGGERREKEMLTRVADALIAERYYRRFLDEVEAHDERTTVAREAGGDGGSGGGDRGSDGGDGDDGGDGGSDGERDGGEGR